MGGAAPCLITGARRKNAHSQRKKNESNGQSVKDRNDCAAPAGVKVGKETQSAREGARVGVKEWEKG